MPTRRVRSLLQVPLEILLVSALAALLIWPVFKTKYYDTFETIDSTFISDGRFLAEHWPAPGWQPLWYGGTRFDYIYPPALRYGTAWLTRIFPIVPARAYHLYTAIFYALGIGGVYFFILVGTRSKGAAALAALGAALLSPSLLFLDDVRKDVIPYMPQRLNVLVRYGEGPHMSAFASLIPTLGLALLALRGRSPRWIAVAAIGAAIVVSNNFYGATSLAVLFPILCWAVWVTSLDGKTWLRAVAIAALAYALTAAWLTPSYIQITTRNLQIVAREGHVSSMLIAAALGAAYCYCTWRWSRGKPELAYTVFVVGAAGFLALNVLGEHYFDFRIAGEPSRQTPECDLMLLLLCIEGLRWLWPRARVLAAILCIGMFLPAYGYVAYPWRHLHRNSEYKHRLEYTIPQWIAVHRPGSRTFAAGSSRLWWNAWFDEAQIGGGSEQGLENFTLNAMQWKLLLAADGKGDVLWLQALGIDSIVMLDERSELPWKDYTTPEKFMGLLPVIFDDGKGNWIHDVPRRHRSLARVVDRKASRALLPLRDAHDNEKLAAYVRLFENSDAPPAGTRWLAPDRMEIQARVREGESVAVMVTYDPYWRAYLNGVSLPIARDMLGQMRIEAPPGDGTIQLVFETPLENRLGRGLGVAGLLICAYLIGKRR